MNLMHSIFFFINIALIVIMIAFLLVVNSQPHSRAQRMFMLFDIFIIVFIAGLEVELLYSRTVGAALSGITIQYLSQCGFLIALLAFIAEFVRIRIPKIVYAFQFAISAVVMTAVLTIPYNKLFYASMKIEGGTDGFFRISCTYGPIWYLHYIYLATVFLFSIAACIVNRHKNSGVQNKRARLVAIGLFITFEELILKGLGVFSSYNPIGIALLAMIICFLFALIRYGYFNTFDIVIRNSFDYDNEGLMVVDPMAVVLFMNRKAEGLFPDINAGDIIPDKSELAGVIRSENKKAVININEEQRKVEEEPVKEQNAYMGSILHFTNITVLNQMIEKEKSANEARRQFMLRVSHELRSPLNVIVGADEMILRDSDDESVTRFAEMIRNEAGGMLGLIEDILQVTFRDSGNVAVEKHPFSLRHMLIHFDKVYGQYAEGKGLDFCSDWDSMPVEEHRDMVLDGDEGKLSQIINNLLSNALKYTRKGGFFLYVSTSDIRDGENAGRIMLSVTVKDTGLGISEEEQEKIFRPFERGSKKNEVGVEGLGLGLSIVREFIEAMGGDISLESRKGLGSSFKVDLPLDLSSESVADEDYEFSEVEDQISGGAFAGRKILVVEDRHQNVVLIEHFLRGSGIEIHEAPDGNRAVKMCRGTRYDAMFIDYLMPGMNGPETLEAVKADEESLNRDTRAVLFSANAAPFVEESCRKAGFEDFLRKPVYPYDLKKMLVKIFSESQLAGRSLADGGSRPVEAAAYDDDTQADEVIKALSAAGVDTERGLEYSDGDGNFYLVMLENFAEQYDADRQELLAAYENIKEESEGSRSDEQWQDFTRLAHSVKGELRGFGDSDGGDLFYALEKAGRERDPGAAESALDAALARWAELVDIIKNQAGPRHPADSAEWPAVKKGA